MAKDTRVIVNSLIGSLCVSAADGQTVHDKIAPLIKAGNSVILSFNGVETVISAFLNAAIGQLYGEFSDDQIRNSLSVEDLEPEDLSLLKRVVDNARVYFQHRRGFDEAWKVEAGDVE